MSADAEVAASDKAAAGTTNVSAEQMTTVGGKRVKAEGQEIREAKPAKGEGDRQVVSLGEATTTSGIKYDSETGHLVNEDGVRVAMTADATDLDVGWTAQHAHPSRGKDALNYPGVNGYDNLPSQTYSTDELPDPLVAIQNGLLPQSMVGLRIDEDKHSKKKSLEP